jgi:aspartyl-tRNA(Asn)/glutamyl-tRNA(Gln) amidotransferase subunit A
LARSETFDGRKKSSSLKQMKKLAENELAYLSIEEAARLLRRKTISALELTEAALAQIARLNPELNAFITVTADHARRAAKIADREISRKRRRGPLQGVPVSLKDNIWTRGIRTTVGSKHLAGYVPAADSKVAARLAQAGAILVGKTNLHEFAWGVTTENPWFGAARNPWSRDRIPGGSSGGSGVAVAAGMGVASVGTDTGGSIRIPSALCGVVGLKPTFGLVSLQGVFKLADSMDHAGPIARSVTDACILLEAIAGDWPKAFPRPDYRKLRRAKPKKFTIGWSKEYFFEDVDTEVMDAVSAAVKTLRLLGGRVEEISLPSLNEMTGPSTVIAVAEATRYHESWGFFPARASEYSSDLRERLESGLGVRAVDFLAAAEQRRDMLREFEEAFEQVDVIVAPTTPIVAPKMGTKEVTIAGKTEPLRAALLRMNRPANYTGHPAISVPCGFTREGLPAGLQLIGPRWGEAQLLSIALAYEDATEWHKRHPVLS